MVLPNRDDDHEDLEPDTRLIAGLSQILIIVHVKNGSLREVSFTANQIKPAFIVADLNAGMFVDEAVASSLLRSINSSIIVVAQNEASL